MRGIIDKDIVTPDDHVGPKNLKRFSFEKAFALLVFHREMVESGLMNQDNAYKIVYQRHLEEKFGLGHKLLNLFNPKIKESLKPRLLRMVNKKMPKKTSGLPETERMNTPSSEEVEDLLKGTTKEELIKLWEQIEPFKTSRDTISPQKITKISPVIIWDIVLVAEMIRLGEKRVWTNEDLINVKLILNGFSMHFSLPEITYKELVVYTERLINKMFGEEGNAKNLFELKEKAAKALQERLKR